MSERHYRLWLRAYPRDYRRRHGLELLTTLLEAAPPGQTRPSLADIADLVRGGLRQRFRLPLGWLVRLVAVAAVLAGAALGAQAGSALGWRLQAEMPSDAAVMVTADKVIEGNYGPAGVVHTDMSGIPVHTPNVLIFAPGWDASAAATRLAAAGWEVSDISSEVRYLGPDGRERRERLEFRVTAFTGVKDGVLLRAYGHEPVPPGEPSAGATRSGGSALTLDPVVEVAFWPQQPLAVPVFAAGFALLAGVAAWLLVAWGAYRLRRVEPAWRILAGFCCAVAGVALALPTSLVFSSVLSLAARNPWATAPEVPMHAHFVGYEPFFVVGAGMVLAAVLAAAVARPMRVPVAD